MPFPFCPLQRGLRGWRDAASPSCPTGSGAARGQVLIPQVLQGRWKHMFPHGCWGSPSLPGRTSSLLSVPGFLPYVAVHSFTRTLVSHLQQRGGEVWKKVDTTGSTV